MSMFDHFYSIEVFLQDENGNWYSKCEFNRIPSIKEARDTVRRYMIGSIPEYLNRAKLVIKKFPQKPVEEYLGKEASFFLLKTMKDSE